MALWSLLLNQVFQASILCLNCFILFFCNASQSHLLAALLTDADVILPDAESSEGSKGKAEDEAEKDDKVGELLNLTKHNTSYFYKVNNQETTYRKSLRPRREKDGGKDEVVKMADEKEEEEDTPQVETVSIQTRRKKSIQIDEGLSLLPLFSFLSLFPPPPFSLPSPHTLSLCRFCTKFLRQ